MASIANVPRMNSSSITRATCVQRKDPYDPNKPTARALATSLVPRPKAQHQLFRTVLHVGAPQADPDSAAHGLGNLLSMRRNNLLWGLIRSGTLPQDQYRRCARSQIAPELRDKHGYPDITRLRVEVLRHMKPSRVLDSAPTSCAST